MDWNKYDFVLAGELRKRIFLLLESPKTPTELRVLIETQDSAVTRSLKDLEKEGLIERLNPNARKGKLFALTDEGRIILKGLMKADFQDKRIR